MIVDQFSKRAHFIPIKKTVKAYHMATLFFLNIFKYHGLPKSIVFDKNPKIMSNFWKWLFENLGTKLNFSLVYHPQMDGLSEKANLTIIDLLKAYVIVWEDVWEWPRP